MVWSWSQPLSLFIPNRKARDADHNRRRADAAHLLSPALVQPHGSARRGSLYDSLAMRRFVGIDPGRTRHDLQVPLSASSSGSSVLPRYVTAGLSKNAHRLFVACALGNLVMAKQALLKFKTAGVARLRMPENSKGAVKFAFFQIRSLMSGLFHYSSSLKF